jgi:hypothetical protein
MSRSRQTLPVAASAVRHAVIRHLGWIVLLKLAALTLLWLTFFSPSHRPRVDAELTSQRLAVEEPPHD